MAQTLNQLADYLESLTSRVKEGSNELKKETAKVIIRDLLFSTPVDTSEAVSNYFATLSSVTARVIPPRVEGKGGSSREASINAALAQALSEIDKAQPGTPIYITNHVEHLVYLNDGTSSQAPAGFVEAAVFRGRKYAREAGIKEL